MHICVTSISLGEVVEAKFFQLGRRGNYYGVECSSGGGYDTNGGCSSRSHGGHACGCSNGSGDDTENGGSGDIHGSGNSSNSYNGSGSDGVYNDSY